MSVTSECSSSAHHSAKSRQRPSLLLDIASNGPVAPANGGGENDLEAALLAVQAASRSIGPASVSVAATGPAAHSTSVRSGRDR